MRSTPYLPGQARVSLSVSDPDGDEGVAAGPFRLRSCRYRKYLQHHSLYLGGNQKTLGGMPVQHHIARALKLQSDSPLQAPYFSTTRLGGSVLADYWEAFPSKLTQVLSLDALRSLVTMHFPGRSWTTLSAWKGSLRTLRTSGCSCST